MLEVWVCGFLISDDISRSWNNSKFINCNGKKASFHECKNGQETAIKLQSFCYNSVLQCYYNKPAFNFCVFFVYASVPTPTEYVIYPSKSADIYHSITSLERFTVYITPLVWVHPSLTIVHYIETFTTDDCQSACALAWWHVMVYPPIASLGCIFTDGAKMYKIFGHAASEGISYSIFHTFLVYISVT